MRDTINPTAEISEPRLRKSAGNRNQENERILFMFSCLVSCHARDGFKKGWKFGNSAAKFAFIPECSCVVSATVTSGVCRVPVLL